MWFNESVRHDYARQGIMTGRKIRDLSHLSNSDNSTSYSLDRAQIRRLAAEVDYLNEELQRGDLSDDRKNEIVGRLTSLDKEIDGLAKADVMSDDAQARTDYGYVKDSLHKMKEVAERGIQAIEEGGEKAWEWEKEHWPQQKELVKNVGKEIERGAEKAWEWEKEKFPAQKEFVEKEIKAGAKWEAEHWPEQKKFVKDIITIPEAEVIKRDEGILSIPTLDKVRINVPTEVDVNVRGDKRRVEIRQQTTQPQQGFLRGLLDF